MESSLIYCLPPVPGKLNGVAVTANSPGIAPFAFHAQHGSTKKSIGEDDVTGFAACTKHIPVHVSNGKDASGDELPRIESHGFGLYHDPAHAEKGAARDEHSFLRDDEEIVKSFYPHCEKLAAELMPGATAAFAFNHVRRISRQTDELEKAGAPRRGPQRAELYGAHRLDTRVVAAQCQGPRRA